MSVILNDLIANLKLRVDADHPLNLSPRAKRILRHHEAVYAKGWSDRMTIGERLIHDLRGLNGGSKDTVRHSEHPNDLNRNVKL